MGRSDGSNGLTTSVSNEVITITSTASDISDTGVLQIQLTLQMVKVQLVVSWLK